MYGAVQAIGNLDVDRYQAAKRKAPRLSKSVTNC